MQLEAAFTESGMNVGGLKMRPFSLGTLSLARQLGLTMFTGPLDAAGEGEEGQIPALSPAELQRQMAVFCWMQTKPLKGVLEHVRTGTWEAEVQEFEFELEVGALPALMGEVERISKLAA